jgi:hypothetical protein
MLKILDLKEQIGKYMVELLSLENAGEFLEASMRFKEQVLYETVFKYILQNAGEVLPTAGFARHIPENEFIKFLGEFLV